MLVIIGATEDGTKELVAVHDGFRESELSWRELLVDLKRRDLKESPNLAIGDGALGFWAALPKVFPKTRVQRCWVHKTANVLNYLPRKVQPTAKRMLQEIWMAENRKDAEAAFDAFVSTYQAKYPKAVGCLVKDREVLLAFYDFLAEHWVHIQLGSSAGTIATSAPVDTTETNRTSMSTTRRSRRSCLLRFRAIRPRSSSMYPGSLIVSLRLNARLQQLRPWWQQPSSAATACWAAVTLSPDNNAISGSDCARRYDDRIDARARSLSTSDV